MPETKDSTIADCQYFFGSVYPLLVGAGRPRYTQRDCCRIDSRTSQCRSGCRLPSLVCVDGRLTMIELPSQGLLGTLPPTVTNLRKLQSLNLMNNQISGIIPGDIGGLSDLTTIALRTNRFNGTIPASLGKLSNLDLLYLDNNTFTEGIPTELQTNSNYRNFTFDVQNVNYVSPSSTISGPTPTESGQSTNVSNDSSSSTPTTSGIVFLVVFGLGILLLAISSLLMCVRRYRQRKSETQLKLPGLNESQSTLDGPDQHIVIVQQ